MPRQEVIVLRDTYPLRFIAIEWRGRVMLVRFVCVTPVAGRFRMYWAWMCAIPQEEVLVRDKGGAKKQIKQEVVGTEKAYQHQD
jgi:hypothetical protein